jgi:hypothetical protein
MYIFVYMCNYSLCIFLSKPLVDGDSQREVAKIVAGQAAAAGPNLIRGNVTGNLTHGQLNNMKYLNVTWSAPGQNLAGPYTCEINAADLNGDNLKFTSNFITTNTAPTIQDLIVLIAQARQEINHCPQIHYEDGTVYCDASTFWEVFGTSRFKHVDVTFSTAYQNVPQITLSVVILDSLITGSTSTRYSAVLNNITTTGFRVDCATRDDSLIYHMEARWTSSGI